MLDTGGAGIHALERGFSDAFPDAYKSRDFPALELGGATDSGLAEFLFEAYEMPSTRENEESFYSSYLARLHPALKDSYHTQTGRKLPGAAELADALEEANHHLGLLTGNIHRAARIKLECFQFKADQFTVGAFGDDHPDRNKLGPIAIERAAKKYRTTYTPQEDVYILGDTLKDIACARACGAKVIAVATGACKYDLLASAKPDYLFEDLSDYQNILSITGLSQ